MQKSWVIGFVTICDKFKNKLLHTSTVSPPPPPPLPKKKLGGCFLFLKFGQRGGQEKIAQK